MDEREAFPAPRPENRPLEGMTGASGDLTPDDPDEAFVPAERREIDDPGAARELTAASHQRRRERRAVVEDDPGSLIPRGDDMPPNDRDGGYGSEHGLSSDDPAYAHETRLPEMPAGTPPRRRPEMGSDKVSEGEDRF